MKPKIVIKSIETTNNKWDLPLESVIIEIDGVAIETENFYGGEPEDNSRMRDYKWVEPLIIKLIKTLGFDVEIEKIEQ